VHLRALNRVSLIAGLLVLIGTVVAIRNVHTEDRGVEVLFVTGLAVGAFLLIVGLVNVLMEPSLTPEEEEDALLEEDLHARRPLSITSAIATLILVLSVVAGTIVGVATGDSGYGIQTFTFSLIFGGVIWGLGLLLGHRPVEEES
jgi:hypothetical protein